MYALAWHNRVVGAAAGKWHTFYHIVALGIGAAVNAERIVGGHNGADFVRRLDGAVMAIGHAAGLAVVVSGSLVGNALVERPVQIEVFLVARELVVVGGCQLGIGKRFVPHTHLVDVAVKVVACQIAHIRTEGQVVKLLAVFLGHARGLGFKLLHLTLGVDGAQGPIGGAVG